MISSLALVLVLAAPSPAQRLADARKLVDELQYEQALKTLNVAIDQAKDVDRETLIGLYALSGIAWSATDKAPKAKEAFQRLLSIDPGYELSKDLPPRTRTPFFEAKTWLAGTTPVAAKVEPARAGEAVTALEITVTDNALVAARALRVTLQVPGQGEVTSTPKLDKGHATVPVGAPSARWTVEVLGDKGVLSVATGEATPIEVAPLVTPPPMPQVQAPAPAPTNRGWMRPTGVTLGVAGLAALAAGGVFGFLSSDARSQISSAQKNEQGVVTGITEREAAQLDAQARTYATVANVLFISGGVLAATGIGLFVFGDDGTPDAPTVTLWLSPLGSSATVRF
jgi:hypothetical protein